MEQQTTLNYEVRPEIIENGDDIQIISRSDETFVSWTVRNIVYSGRELNAIIVCAPIINAIAYTTRINLLSTSARDGLARQLSHAFGKSVNWVLMINQVCTKVEGFLSARNKAVDLSVVTEDENNYLLHPFIAENSANMIFGKGGSGKSYLSLAFGIAIASGEALLDYVPTSRKKVLFIDYESSGATFKRRINQISPLFFQKNPQSLFYYGMSAPLIDQVDIIKQQINELNIGFVVIDSAGLAAGGRPEEAENALKFFAAIKRLKTTILVIAHETKQEGGAYPFGSVFFYNSFRNIWNTSTERTDLNDNAINTGLFHRKSNEDKLMYPRAVRIYFGQGGVEFSKGSVSFWEKEQTVSQRIKKLLLSDGPKKLKEISETLDINKETINKNLHRLKRAGELENSDNFWSLNASENTPKTHNEKNEGVPCHKRQNQHGTKHGTPINIMDVPF